MSTHNLNKKIDELKKEFFNIDAASVERLLHDFKTKADQDPNFANKIQEAKKLLGEINPQPQALTAKDVVVIIIIIAMFP
jgi:hypothetical protein